MKYTIKDHTGSVLHEYEGFMRFDIKVLNSIKVSAATPMPAPRVLAIVPNEGELDYWIVDAINTVEALKELARFYREEESWVDFSRVYVINFTELSNVSALVVRSLVNEGYLKPSS